MNAYEQLKAARIERLRERAEKVRARSESSYNRFRRIADGIPMGQPILVGHHSEKRHRRDIARMDSAMSNSVKDSKYAEHLERRANAAENNGAISSCDPDALPKLRAKLAAMEARQKEMKTVNAAFKKGKLADLGFTPEQIERINAKVEAAYSWEKQPFPSWQLTNNNGNMRRVKERIALLEKAAVIEFEPIEVNGITVTENAELNSIEVSFPAKPSDEIISQLKHYGFRWSGRNKYWYAAKLPHRVDFVRRTFAENNN